MRAVLYHLRKEMILTPTGGEVEIFEDSYGSEKLYWYKNHDKDLMYIWSPDLWNGDIELLVDYFSYGMLLHNLSSWRDKKCLFVICGKRLVDLRRLCKRAMKVSGDQEKELSNPYVIKLTECNLSNHLPTTSPEYLAKFHSQIGYIIQALKGVKKDEYYVFEASWR